MVNNHIKRFVGTLCISSFFFITVADAADLKSVNNIKSEAAKLRQAVVNVKNIGPTIQRMARRDANFRKAVINDLEKSCGGKAKQNRACGQRYAKNIQANITRLLRSDRAVSHLAKRLDGYRLNEVKKLKTLVGNFNKNIPRNIDNLNSEFNNQLRNKLNRLPNKDKIIIQNRLKRNNSIFNKNRIIQDMRSNGSIRLNSNFFEEYEANFFVKSKQELERTLGILLTKLVKPAHADGGVTAAVTVGTLMIIAVDALRKYVNFKLEKEQLDKTAICIDNADRRRNSCLNGVRGEAQRDCRELPTAFGIRRACIIASEGVRNSGCHLAHAADVTACALLPQ